MQVNLAYGDGVLPTEFPDLATTVIRPRHQAGLADEEAALQAALAKPIGAPPLATLLKPTARVCIVFTDITRATPNQRLIPWLLGALAAVPPEQVLLLNGTGTHRPNTAAELARMLTPEVVDRYRVLNHEAEDQASLIDLGTTRRGTPIRLNRHLVEADLRLITGFIEPHFFAGFSGGPKGIMPGVAGLDTVMRNHGAANLADPNAAFGITHGNPVWEEMSEIALRAGPSFLVNVTLNEARQITGVFAGDLLAAHQAGCEFVRQSAMQPVDAAFDVVVTTNSGYPLDLNLYQGVKGLSAAARIVKPGGTIVLACECREGVPAGSPFDRLLRRASSAEELLAQLAAAPREEPEQWQAQILARILRHIEVLTHSALPDDVLRRCHLVPCPDIAAAVRDRLARSGPAARVAVLPQGPLTIPYLPPAPLLTT